MYTVSDLRKGLKILVEGQPYTITEFEFCKPGKGTALYRCKLKHLIAGNTMERTYRPNDRFDKPDLLERDVAFVYQDGDRYVFSDISNYEEVYIPEAILDFRKHFLAEGMECNVLFFNNQPIEITLPVFVEKNVVQTEPGVRGDTATNVLKPATLDGGYTLQVPLFVVTGDRIKVDTRNGSYVERVKSS